MQVHKLTGAVAAIVFGTAVALFQGAAHARPTPVGTAFTYQGQLKQGGEPIDNTADLQFTLWDGSDGSATQIGTTLQINALDIVEGAFTVDLDFGTGVFGADARWLQIAVRSPAGSGTFTTLSPRQRVRPAPVAAHALSVNGATVTNLSASNIATGTIGSSLLSGTYSNAMTFANAGNSYVGSGAGLTSLNASNLSTGTIGSALLSGTYSNALTLNNAGNVLAGNGAGLTNLNASNIAAGTIANARTTGTSANTANTLVLRDASGNFLAGTVTATHAGNGAGLTNLNASNITTGTLPPTALSGNYVNSVGFVQNVNFGQNIDVGQNITVNGPVTSGTGFIGSGNGLYDLKASRITDNSSGPIPGNALQGGSYGQCTFTNSNFSGNHIGNGFGLVALNPAALTNGAVPSNCLYGYYTEDLVFNNPDNAFTGSFAGDGGQLQNVVANNLVGNLNSARMPTGGTWALLSTQFVTGPAGFAAAIRATSADFNGIEGVTNANPGVGVYGINNAGGRGVVGQASGAGSWGVFAQGNSGASGTKSFQIDHPRDPENKYLLHYSAEGPEPYNLYRGNVILNGVGEAWVQLPDYFEDINRDFHYQLTSIGAPSPNLHVALEVVNNEFMVAGGKPGAKVSWTVTAVRNDEYVRHYPTTDVREKPDALKGTYQHPEIFGQPAEMSEAHRRANLANQAH